MELKFIGAGFDFVDIVTSTHGWYERHIVFDDIVTSTHGWYERHIVFDDIVTSLAINEKVNFFISAHSAPSSIG